MAIVSKPIIYTLILAVGASAYMMMGGGAKSQSSIEAAQRSRKSKKADLYRPEDYTARFTRLASNTKDSFAPLVARAKASAAAGPDAIPADLAAGDPNWVFTGSSEIDGVSSILLENRVTFESEFVKRGERWKNCTVSAIQDGRVVFTSQSGRRVTVKLADPSTQTVAGGPQLQAQDGLRPVNPALSGPIGRQVAVRPETPRASTRGRNTQEQSDAN